MAEELQNLLERIQKDGVQKAEQESGRIVSQAREKADALVKEAEDKAAALVKNAEQDAAQFMERSKRTLEQAARDVVLSVGDAVAATMEGIAAHEVAEALKPDTLKKILVSVIKSYCEEQKSDRITVLLSAEDQKAIADFLMSKFKARMKKGLEIKADAGVTSGFKVSIVDENIEHDLSVDAVTDALSQLVRPQLAEILKKAQAGKEAQE